MQLFSNYIILSGGLGNQMFQYAFALALRHRGHHVVMDASLYNYARMHNGYELQRAFGINEPLINKKGLHLGWLRFLIKYKPSMVLSDDPLYYDERFLINPRRYIFGYWQNENYFLRIEDQIRKEFVFQEIDNETYAIAKEASSCNSVSIHIRRGDYLEYGMLIHGVDYYSEAIHYISDHEESPFFYVFSDDKNIAKLIVDRMDVSYRLVCSNNGVDSYKDMYLMSRCKHNIICNSSFSWWGAWLNDNKDKIVVAPQIWSERRPDLRPQPQDWVLI